MSARTIKRGGKSARKVAAAQGKAQRVRSARARTGSVFDSVMAWLPLSEGQLHRIFLAIILGLVAVGLWLAASFAGVPAMARNQVAVFAHDAGFELRNVNVRGTNNLNELKIYQIALGDRNRAMPFVDVGALRERLKALPWVEDARVSRQLPDTLVIDIVERKPVAVLQKVDRLVLIDKDGIELETVGEARAKGKLRLNGPGAGRQVAVLSELLDAAPALRPQLKGAEWVGNRRWNLTFKTGQVLALPEGKEKSAKALMTFAQLDGRNRLLGGKAVAFDMRASDRIYFRLPGRTDALETQARPAPSDGAEPKSIESTKQAAAASPKSATKPKENP